MTMALSERSDDYKLSKALGRLFHAYPDFKGLRFLSKQDMIERILASRGKGGCGFGDYNKPNGSGNDDRLHSIVNLFFNKWSEKITEQNIDDLEKLPFGSGWGPKFTRTLRAYCFGNKDVLLLDTQASSALRDPLFPEYCNSSDYEIRKDIEDKLRGEPEVSLIDFHEMLRFLEQYSRAKSDKAKKNIIIGWNAWRLLCANERERIGTDWKWLQENLVEDESIAKELCDFYRQVTGL